MRSAWIAVTTAVSSISLISGAVAADMAVKAPRVAPAAAPYWHWSGFYAGVNLGGGIGDVSMSGNSRLPNVPPPNDLLSTTAHLSAPGVIGGGQIGYNWQIAPMWLTGLEADFQGTGQKGSGTFSQTIPEFATTDTVGAKINWLGTVRGRLGVLTNGNANFWYVTGGFAYGRTELALAHRDFDLALAATFSQINTGWTVGGGLETHLVANWTGKIEYLYVDLGSIHGTAHVAGGINLLSSMTASADVRDHIVRAGLNYKLFDGPTRNVTAATPYAPWNWGGFYLGVNLGGGISDTSVAQSSSSPAGGGNVPAGSGFLSSATHMSMPGVIGGGQIGYNWQFTPMWLAGLEVDFQGTGQKGSVTNSFGFVANGGTDSVDVKTKWLGTVRGRLGVLTNGGANLWYATGGLAYGRTQLSVTSSNYVFPNFPATGTFTHDKVGWTIGGGVESHIIGNWTGKLEYVYVDLGSIQDTAQGFSAPGVIGTATTVHADVRDHIVRAGVNYKFW